MTSYIEVKARQFIKRELRFKKFYILIFRGEENTEYELRTMLRWINIPTSGDKSTLIKRFSDYEIEYGTQFPVSFPIPDHIEFVPKYVLKVLAKRSGLPIKTDLIKEIKEYLQKEQKSFKELINHQSDDFDLVCEALKNVGSPSQESISVMEKYGYTYSSICNNYVDMITKEKVSGEKHTTFESLLFSFVQYVNPDHYDF